MITASAQEPAAVGITISETRKGVPSNTQAVLEMDGKPTKPFSTSSTIAQVIVFKLSR